MGVSRWDKFYNKGKRDMESLSARLGNSDAQDPDPIAESEMSEKLATTWKKVSANEITLRNGVEGSDHFFDVNAKLKKLKTLYYHSFFSPRPGVIIAASNEGYDKSSNTTMPWKWSKTIGTLWMQACTKDNLLPSSLKWIFRDTITNPETRDVLKEALLRTKVNMKTLDTIEKTFTRKDEAFYAIMGTPNGNGIPWLLKEYAHHLGEKTVTSITILAEMDDPTNPLFDLKFAIGKAPTRESTTATNTSPPEIDPQNAYDDEDDGCGCHGLSCTLM
ncbi:hypothetical protein N7492_005530 [Penicillium capsulatum]|uniref:Uncharacterized protein n=1 Tax=Penicillium capsulatum TaxID=69766 RepID=A0A9W9IFX0_9EURO|nr:hypothetical protein N7492_005530 [Penicillium capsulatum]KAJ6135369.1 hypothetical protein N7512_000529 [Penicillium capsulatum]